VTAAAYAATNDSAANARRGKLAAASGSARNRVRLLWVGLEAWLREQRSRLSRFSSVAEPIDRMLRRWDRFARFTDDEISGACASRNLVTLAAVQDTQS
jgi:hypothetical protein